MPRLSSRVPGDFAPNPLASLLADKRRQGRPVLDLTVTNPTRTGLPLVEPDALAALSDPRVRAYEPDPLGCRSAHEAVAAYYAERGEGRAEVDPDRVILAASTSEAYTHLFRLLCDPGDEVLVPSPSYPLFEPLARLDSVELRPYRLRYQEPGWVLERDSLEAALGSRARAVVLVQPNNPTGSLIQPEDLDWLETACAARGVAIIADEVFADFPWAAGREALPTVLAAERRALTFALGGISKLCGLPQMKLAWIALGGPSREIEWAREGLEWIADLFLSVGTPIQVALPRFLAGRIAFQTAARARIRGNLDFLRRTAGRSGFRLLEGDGGWSAVLRFGTGVTPAHAADRAEWALREHDVLLHPGHFYDLPDSDGVLSLIVEPFVLEEAGARLGGGG